VIERRSPAKGWAANASLPDRRAPEPCEGMGRQRVAARPSSAGALRRDGPPTRRCPTVERRSPAKGWAANASLPDRRAPEPCEGMGRQRVAARPSSAGALRRRSDGKYQGERMRTTVALIMAAAVVAPGRAGPGREPGQ